MLSMTRLFWLRLVGAHGTSGILSWSREPGNSPVRPNSKLQGLDFPIVSWSKQGDLTPLLKRHDLFRIPLTYVKSQAAVTEHALPGFQIAVASQLPETGQYGTIYSVFSCKLLKASCIAQPWFSVKNINIVLKADNSYRTLFLCIAAEVLPYLKLWWSQI